MGWNGDPKPGSRWRCPRLYVGNKIVQSTEARLVVDRTLGGDVIYKLSSERYQYSRRVTESEWNGWVKESKAKRSKR